MPSDLEMNSHTKKFTELINTKINQSINLSIMLKRFASHFVAVRALSSSENRTLVGCCLLVEV